MSLHQLYKRLGIENSDSLILLTDSSWKNNVSFPSRVVRLLEDTDKWTPQALFCFDNKPLILFFENPKDLTGFHKAVWNFNETPIVIVSENEKVTIYNGFEIDENTALLKELGGNDSLDDFSYFELVTGKTFEKHTVDFDNKNRVDYKLLKNIEETQKELIDKYHCHRNTANALIGKIIFIRYLIDRKVRLNFNNESKFWSTSDLCDLLSNKNSTFNFFNYLLDKEKGFNGSLFPIEQNEFDALPNDAFTLIIRLLEGENIRLGQKSLFQLYDFSILPIEFISNVYEKFIGKENQARSGAYYTPTFLVDYIVNRTIDKKLKSNKSITMCKVFDPACGSGIFLVETLRKIIEKYIELNGIPDDKEEFKSILKKLVLVNIFGLDKDESAVQVAIFSIYLTLLDYQKPAEIENFKFPNLLNTNFFVADFFDTDAEYNAQLKKIDFDFILGNPPWGGGTKGLDTIGRKYIVQRRKKEQTQNKDYKIGVSNNEIAEGFVLRASDFCCLNTQVAFIIRSSILYNIGYSECSPFRKYWLQEFFIDHVFELAPVRHEVFDRSSDPAIAPAAIVFYRYADGSNTDLNIVEHITLKPSSFFSKFKIFTINRSDYQEVEQIQLKQFDWLWKTLVYGSYLDFNLLNRIKNGYPTIKIILSNESKFTEGTGIQFSSNPKYDSRHLIDRPFVDATGVEPFFINSEKISPFDKLKVHRIRNDKPQIFHAPMLLCRMGLDLDNLTVKSAISKQDLLFKNSITSISVNKVEDLNYLYNIQSVFSSALLTYYAINSFAFIGIEREQTQNYDKYSLPYIDLNLQNEIEEIENAKIELYKKKKNAPPLEQNFSPDEKNIEPMLKNLNEKVLEKLGLSDCEQSLIDYALTVNKTMIVGSDTEKALLFAPIDNGDPTLINYASLFINRFAKSFNSNGKIFIVKIWHTKQIIGMLFEIINEVNYKSDILFIDKQNESAIMNFITKLGSENITDQLFVQKDIRGFEKNSFYIFKPNEKRLWHKAIGYLDVNEFADAILKTGKNSK